MKKQASIKSQKLLTSVKTEENVMENLESDIILKDKNSILVYIKILPKTVQERGG